MKQISYIVKAPDEGLRLDAVLAKNFPQYSRALWKSTINKEPARVNGKLVKSNFKPKLGQEIIVSIPAIVVSKPVLKAPDVLPPIIFEDKDVIVINKPAGLLTHPSAHSHTPSVAGAFTEQVVDDDKLRPGIVHRLDRDTSGVMILARHSKAKDFLQAEFKERKVGKIYIALVRGRLKDKSAKIDLPLLKSKKQPNTMVVAKSGRQAVSVYKVIAEYPSASLVEIKLLTGRTHQIRAQFAHIGHPVIGDIIYGNKALPDRLDRQFLHSSELEIVLPNGKKQTFKAPLPVDLKVYLDRL
jgi:23S rRNA pseudouridine1911/1915/1917 synthase